MIGSEEEISSAVEAVRDLLVGENGIETADRMMDWIAAKELEPQTLGFAISELKAKNDPYFAISFGILLGFTLAERRGDPDNR